MSIGTSFKNSKCVFLAGLALGIALSVLYYTCIHASVVSKISPLRESDLNAAGEYHFIDPLLGLKNESQATPPAYEALQKSIEQFINSEEYKGDALSVSVSFADINAHASVHVNPDETYTPGSLLNVPSMIAYFKLAEFGELYVK